MKYYLRARYYNQNVGRFTQQDTWMGTNYDPASLHKYTYAHNDPVSFVDPSGKFISVGFSGSAGLSMASVSVGVLGRFIGRAALSTFVVGKRVGTQLRKEIILCRKSKGKKCNLPNVDISGSDYLTQQEHIRDVQLGRGSNGVPITPVVTYRPNRKEWGYRNLAPCQGKTKLGSGKHCDEYPFNTTNQGGASFIELD